MATIHDVARAAGVSIATVSRTFAAKQPLRHETQLRVLREAERLNYHPRRPNRIGSGVERNQDVSHRLIGFQYFSSCDADSLPTNSFFNQVLAGAHSEADIVGFHLVLHSSHRAAFLQSIPKMISDPVVDGILLAGTADTDIVHLIAKSVPKIVLIDNRDRMMEHDCVVSDSFRGGSGAMEYLLGLGHRRIAFLTSYQFGARSADRQNGYLCALFGAGLDVDRRLMLTLDSSQGAFDSCAAVDQVAGFLKSFSPNKRPTAILTSSDIIAVVALNSCRQLSLSVPSDISIVGFDDANLWTQTYPALTTMRVDKELMGRVAVRRLHKRLTETGVGDSVDPPVAIELPVTLVERGSCAPPAYAS